MGKDEGVEFLDVRSVAGGGERPLQHSNIPQTVGAFSSSRPVIRGAPEHTCSRPVEALLKNFK